MSDEKKLIIPATISEATPSARIETFTPEEMKHVKKLIYLKRFAHSPRWHFALPDTVSLDGILCFCGLKIWAKEQTNSQKVFYARLENERGEICEYCAAEYKLAESELRRQNYI